MRRPTVPTDPRELAALLDRARGGDESALPAVRELLKDPAAVDRCGGDLAGQAERSLLRAMCGENLSFREALTRKLELLKAELAGPDAPPLERLLAERVAACWLQLQHADMVIAQYGEGMTPRLAEYHERYRQRAHGRYLSSIKALALVRRLAPAAPRAAAGPPPNGYARRALPC